MPERVVVVAGAASTVARLVLLWSLLLWLVDCRLPATAKKYTQNQVVHGQIPMHIPTAIENPLWLGPESSARIRCAHYEGRSFGPCGFHR